MPKWKLLVRADVELPYRSVTVAMGVAKTAGVKDVLVSTYGENASLSFGAVKVPKWPRIPLREQPNAYS